MASQIKLNEQPRRICHQETSRTFAVCTTDGNDNGFVRLMDSQTFEMIHPYTLESTEFPCSVTSCSFADDPNTYFVVCMGLGVHGSLETSAGNNDWEAWISETT